MRISSSMSNLSFAAAQPLHYLERSSLSLSAHSKLCHDTRGRCACTMPASTLIFHTVAPTWAICHTKHTIWQDSLFACSQGMQTTIGTTQRANQPYSTSGTAPVHCARDSSPVSASRGLRCQRDSCSLLRAAALGAPRARALACGLHWHVFEALWHAAVGSRGLTAGHQTLLVHLLCTQAHMKQRVT